MKEKYVCFICGEIIENPVPWQLEDGQSVGNFIAMMYHQSCFNERENLSDKKRKELQKRSVSFVYNHLDSYQKNAVDVILS